MTKHTASANDLFETAHYALSQGRWADARRALDALAARNDNCQLFCEPGSYGEPGHISDRIALCNDRAQALNDYCARCDCSVAEAVEGRP